MEIIVNEPVFNRSLRAKAVHITGMDVDGETFDNTFLVKEVNGEEIVLVAFTGKIYYLHIESFQMEDGLQMKVWEEVTNG